MDEAIIDRFRIPGTDEDLLYERDAAGRLMRLSCGGRVYFERRDGAGFYGDGLAVVRETATERSLLRHVQAGAGSWLETYRSDEKGRVVEVDGVTIRHDERNRVVACSGPDGEWRYRYSAAGLIGIDGPDVSRRVERGPDGRPTRVREGPRAQDIRYDEAGRRLDVQRRPPPAGWRRDELGRLWTVADAAGRVTATFLWEGLACLGRVDGPPGGPLAAVFSLDLSLTPVRVITPGGAVRVPRDALGEGLLAHPGVPGLFGGAVHAGTVVYRSRVLDPRLAAFDRPDPWSGDEDDPRRQAMPGYRGPLWAEAIDTPYAVCQGDPVSRTDPTGEISASTIFTPLSSLTWATQNSVLSWVGFDLTINLWGSLLTFNLTGHTERFFENFIYGDVRTGKRQQTFAFRRDGFAKLLLPPGQQTRVMTIQQIIWSMRSELDKLDVARVVDPKGEFLPALYGTLLLARPGQGDAIPLVGDANVTGSMGLQNWTRSGGAARPILPGSDEPRFPCGGLHLDVTQTGHHSGEATTLAELEPAGTWGSGLLGQRARIVIARTGLGLAAGGLVLLTDAQKRAAILKAEAVEEVGGETHVWLESDPTDIDRTGLRLRGLQTPAASSEDIPRVGSQAAYLNLAGVLAVPAPAPNYSAADPVRFLDPAGPVLGAGLIQRFEASLTLDAALPANLQAPLTVQHPVPTAGGGATLTADPRVLEFGAGAAPGQGQAIVVSVAPRSIAVVVTAAGGTQRTVDRDVNPALNGAAGDAVTWQILNAPGDIGQRDTALDPADPATLVFKPTDERTAPPANDFVLVHDANGAQHARTVSGVNYDALVFENPVPAGPATVRVERYAIAPGLDEGNVSLSNFLTLTLSPPVAPEGVVMQLVELDGPAIAATLTTTPAGQFATIAGATAMLTAIPLGGSPPFPAQFVLLQAGAVLEGALVRRLGLTLTLDRRPAPAIDGVPDLELVRLTEAGPSYSAQAIDATHVVVRPDVAGTAVQMPRLRAGNLVEARGTGLGTDQLYRVEAVERNGTALTLADGPGLPAPAPADLTLTLLGPDDPGNGGTRDGIHGTAQTPAVGNTLLTCDVWTFGSLSANLRIGIAAGDVTHPARIQALSNPQVEFAAAPGVAPAAGAPVSILAPVSPRNAFSTHFRREGNSVLILDDNPAGLTPPGPNLVVAVPFRETALKVEQAELSSGTALVPDDPESVELDRLQSLIDHELRHTEQSSMWGPLLLTWTPLLAFQVPVELSTEIGMPQFSAYVAATVLREEAGGFIQVPDTPGIAFATGDIVQVSETLAGSPVAATLGERLDDHRFRLSTGAELAGDALLVRKAGDTRDVAATVRVESGGAVLTLPDLQDIAFGAGDSIEIRRAGPAAPITLGARRESDGAFAVQAADVQSLPTGSIRVRRAKANTRGWDIFFRLMQLFTAGGIMNLVAGTIWGGILFGIGKLAYFTGRHLFTSDPSHGATVSDDKLSVTVEGTALPENLRGVQRVTIRAGNSVVVRSVTAISGTQLTLSSALEVAGQVQVAPYATRNAEDAWDWHGYYPATVPDLARPTAIRVEDVNGDHLALRPFDRVMLKAGNLSRTTRVTAVAADGTVELEEIPPASGDEHALRVARLGSDDPLRPYDEALLHQLDNMDWLRWFFDPWGQLHYRTQPERGSFWDWVARIARYAFSTRSWGLLPLPGWFFWDNLVKQIGNNGHLSQMEQDAAESSGDLYSPMSRLRPDEGSLTVVGDIARFWHFPWRMSFTNDRRDYSILSTGRRDSPGTRYGTNRRPRLLPSAASGPAGTPNGTINGDKIAAAGSGAQLPDLLVAKSRITVADPTETTPASFMPSEVAWVPLSPRVERSVGAYVAFSEPGTHRLSVSDQIDMAAQAKAVHDGGHSFLFPVRQPILFDVSVQDVTADVAGRRVGENDTVTLVETQRAVVDVSPKDGRRYAVTLLRPETGPVLRADGDDAVVAQATTGSEPAEISRFYQFTPAAAPAACDRLGSFDSGRLNEHGAHIAHDIHVPVRRLSVAVVDTLAVRGAVPDEATLRADLALNAGAINELHPGEQGFVLVPAPILSPLHLDHLVYAAAALPAPTDPVPDIDGETVDHAPAGWLSDGAAFKIALDAQDPPEERATATFQVDVGQAGNSAVLRATVDLVPHFRLVLAAGVDYRVARGSSLILQCSDGVSAGVVVVTPSAGITVSTAGADVTLAVDAAADVGPRRVVVQDAADATHRARRTIEIVP